MKLEELIQLAEKGSKFTAKCPVNFSDNWTQEDFLGNTLFTAAQVTADWTVTFKREPRVIWVPITLGGHMSDYWFNSEKIANEYFHNGSIKFIEVLESDDSK